MAQTKYKYRGFTIVMIERFKKILYKVIGGTKYYQNLEEAKKAVDNYLNQGTMYNS